MDARSVHPWVATVFHAGFFRGEPVELAAATRVEPSPYMRVLSAILGGCALVISPMASAYQVSLADGHPHSSGSVVVESGSARATEHILACLNGARLANVPGAADVKAASVAGLIAREDGHPHWDGSRIKPQMSAEQFSRFASLHEDGHCEDDTMPVPSAVAAMPQGDREYMGLLWENFADVYATVTWLSGDGNPSVPSEWADLRVIGVVENGVRHQGGDAWARYDTTTAIDAAVSLFATSGTNLHGMTKAQIIMVTKRIVESVNLTRGRHENLLRAVPRVSMRDGKTVLLSGLPSGFAGRLETALKRTGIMPRATDAEPIAAHR